ncbi:hypothetical protein TNCV_1892261 [Trichonephila clavipes]|nr:hypothetical protein TNCV_1892261 [Trichonephila clavipes]
MNQKPRALESHGKLCPLLVQSRGTWRELRLLPAFSPPDMTFWQYTSTGLACPLCGYARMDSDHLLQCTGLDEYPTEDIVSPYWEVWCQMVKKPNTNVG